MIREARDDLVDALEAMGLVAVDDPRDLEPPGVLVGLADDVDWWTACGPSARVRVSIVAPPPGDRAAVDWLASTLEAVLKTLTNPQDGPAKLTTYDVGNGQRLPAYDLFVTIT